MYASGASVDETERHDENYVCIIFNFPSTRWQNRRYSGTPYEDSRDYKNLTATVCVSSNSLNRRIGANQKLTWLI